MNYNTAIRTALSRLGTLALCMLFIAQGASGRVPLANDNALIAGREIQTFEDDGEQVSVVLGDFSLTVGDRKISGRDGVVWLTTETVAAVEQNVIHIYVEGEAKIVEPDGTETGDHTLYIMLRTTGRVTAEALQQSEKTLKDLPLYRRGRSARRLATQGPEPDDDETPAAPRRAEQLPELIFSDTPADDDVAPPASRQTNNGGSVNVPFEVVELNTGRQADPDRNVAPPANEPDTIITVDDPPAPKTRAVVPVNFYADEVTSEMINGRRVTIARGNVYLSQGAADSDDFLELRAQEAVIFSAVFGADGKPMPAKDTNAPGSMGMVAGRESIVGVYLEGDVIMARGERYMRGPDAYYDFTTDRAIMTEGVFRTVQEQRNIPIVLRFKEGRMLSAREMWFQDAKVSTSEFHTPTYDFRASRVYMMDTTAYDEKGVRLSQRRWLTDMRHVTTNVRGVPVWYSPRTKANMQQGHTALKSLQAGWESQFGPTFRTEWHLFRLLGLVKPEGYSATLHMNYERGPSIGLEGDYERENYRGYALLWALIDDEAEDEFGREAKNIEAPENRGRILWRHKQFLPRDWQMQFELSYLADRNYLREFFSSEFYSGKEQETLVYAKKQRDNWAVDVLLQARVNQFLTQTESAPDVGVRIIGEPLMNDTVAFFGEAHVGAKRWRPASLSSADKRRYRRMGLAIPSDSNWMARGDVRAEATMPFNIGPVRVVAFNSVRATGWSDSPSRDGENARLYTQVGMRASMDIWRIYNNVQSRLLDVNRLKIVFTPDVGMFIGSVNGVSPDNLFPLSPAIEEHITRLSGGTFGGRVLVQTKRGEGDDERTVNWMELAAHVGIFDANENFNPPADGRYFMSRPEYSMGSNFINFDYNWHISDSTLLMAEMNWDMDSGEIGVAGLGLEVQRSPRFSYFVGLRSINDLSSMVGTYAIRYRINSKYEIAFVEQYDFDYDNGTNLTTSMSITRKFPRWFVQMGFTYDARYDDFTVIVNLWPEGIPEAGFKTDAFSIRNRSDKN